MKIDFPIKIFLSLCVCQGACSRDKSSESTVVESTVVESIEQLSPLELLEYLSATESFVVYFNDSKENWVTYDELLSVLPFLGDDTPCAPVFLEASSHWPTEASTISDEVYFIIEGYIQGKYPPSLSSLRHKEWRKAMVDKWMASKKMNPVTIASERNDITDSFVAQLNLTNDYGMLLLGQLDSAIESIIWKNYILQKLDVLYLHPDIGQETRAVILDRLWKECQTPTPTFAGTSLMTLLRLHEQKPEVIPADKLADRCEWVIQRPAYSNSDRMSALHVLAAIDQPQATETARGWLTIPGTAPMFQQTALNILGKAPTSADRQLIETFINHPDFRLSTAAKTALNEAN